MIYYLMFTSIFSVGRSMHHVGSGSSSRSENDIRSPGTVVMGGYQASCVCWDSDSNPLQEL